MICLAATGSASASMPKMETEPASGREQAGHHAQGRGLAGAVGAEQGIKFAGADGEVERVDRGAVKTLR